MTPLFKLDPNVAYPIPVLAVNADGSPREADGRNYFTVEDAAAARQLDVEELTKHWRGAMRAFIADDEKAETITDLNTGEVKEINFETLSDEEILERSRRRQRGDFSLDEWSSFTTQAKAMGYDLDKRECYPKRVVDEVTNIVDIVCVVKIEVLESRVLASGKYDGSEVHYRGPGSGEWLETWSEPIPPHECKVKMWRIGVSRPVLVSGTWETYNKLNGGDGTLETANKHWKFNGAFQLSKCLRARAYREQFRDVVGNAYISEEFADTTPSQRRAARDGRAEERSYSIDPDRNADGSYGRPVPAARQETDAANDTIAPTTEAMLRAQLALRGIQKSTMDRHLNEARAIDRGQVEVDDPEAFFGAIYGKIVAQQPRRRAQ